MKGMFSSSLNKEIAVGYAAANAAEGKIPCVFIIQWGHAQVGHFLVDKDPRYSKFEEEEVTIMDKCNFWVTNMNYKEEDRFGEMIDVM